MNYLDIYLNFYSGENIKVQRDTVMAPIEAIDHGRGNQKQMDKYLSSLVKSSVQVSQAGTAQKNQKVRS